MARIKLGPVITDIAGSVGGATFQRNRFGITMRSKPLPLRSATIPQQVIRTHMDSLQNSWRDLTDAQRLQWDRFIDFSGQTIRKDRSVLLSGYNLYLKYQLFRLLYNMPLLTTIAYIPMPDFNPLQTIGEDAGVYYLDFSGSIVHTSYFFVCKLTSPRLANRSFNPRGLRFIWVIMATGAAFTINQKYIEAFGALPPIGSVVHCTIQYFSVLAPVFSGVIPLILPVESA